jgi:hypothetical protein
MDLTDCPNKDRLGAYGFMDTGYDLSQLSNLDIYIVLLSWDRSKSVPIQLRRSR